MDPEATLNLCDQAISDCGLAEAQRHIAAYRAWRARGGFEPYMRYAEMRGDAFATECSRRIESLEMQEGR